MHEIPLKLTGAEFAKLNRQFPKSGKSADIGRRAMALIHIYAKEQGWKEKRCPPNGVDIAFQTEKGPLEIEVKGTGGQGIQWGKLMVSGNPSYSKLTCGSGIPLYRVSDVFGRNPIIYVLKWKRDFSLTPEPRWKISRL